MAERPKELTSASARAQRKALLGDDDATMVFETSKEVTVVNTFDRMNLRQDLLRGIYAYGKPLRLLCEPRLVSFPRAGFEKPSAIQQRAIIPIVKGRDVIAQ